MNNGITKRQKEVMQYQLDAEKEILKKLTAQYQRALNDIDRKIRILQSDELTQSRIYRIEYQKVLKKQVEAILEKLHADEYTTIQQFLSDTYTDAFVGTAYDMFGQGVPLIMPIDRNAAVKAVVTDSKISEGLYEALGVDTKKLKNSISAEITRGIASGLLHSQIAQNLANAAKAPLGRAKTIVRTESHRIQEAAAQDARKVAISKGANVVKQWKAIKDGKTRHSHRVLDGQVREVDEPFELYGKEAMYPGDFGDPAEDCNCRCRSTQRARILMNNDEYKNLQERARFFGLMEEDSKEFGHEKGKIVFSDFKKKYLKAAEKVDIPLENTGKSGIIKGEDIQIGRSVGAKAKNHKIDLPNKEVVYLTEGSRVTHVHVIAGKGRNREIDILPKLLDKYKNTVAEEWQKMKGVGYIDYNGESYKAELHWYEEPSVGRVEWKVKPDADGNWFIYED